MQEFLLRYYDIFYRQLGDSTFNAHLSMGNGATTSDLRSLMYNTDVLSSAKLAALQEDGIPIQDITKEYLNKSKDKDKADNQDEDEDEDEEEDEDADEWTVKKLTHEELRLLMENFPLDMFCLRDLKNYAFDMENTILSRE